MATKKKPIKKTNLCELGLKHALNMTRVFPPEVHYVLVTSQRGSWSINSSMEPSALRALMRDIGSNIEKAVMTCSPYETLRKGK